MDVAALHRQQLQRALGPDIELRELVGRGGFGEVFAGWDKRLKRQIAIKTLRGVLLGADQPLERFRREAEAIAKLRHAHVIPIFTVGEADGVAYFTMPLIEGETLATLLEREGRVPPLEACRILGECARALHAAHRAGILHRDVKPENIMLEGHERSAVVMDFGIAKSLGETTGTSTGVVVGTVAYMSPEQAAAERDLTPRSDQYSLGAVGYRMLTGHLPQTTGSAPISEYAPDVPEAVESAIARALSQSPADRFESMEEFAAAIAGTDVSSRSSARSHRPSTFTTRVASMRAALTNARTWVGAAVIGLALYAALATRSAPSAALRMAAMRSEAVFAARRFLEARTGGMRRPTRAWFMSQDTTYRFLAHQFGRSALETRALTDIPVWEWRIAFRSPDRRDNWLVWVGPSHRITGFLHAAADSTPVSPGADAARAIALGTVAAVGWHDADLVSPGEVTIAPRGGAVREFRWRVAGTQIPWRGADTAAVTLSVLVRGDSALQYREALQIPTSYGTSESPSLDIGPFLAVAGLVVIAVLLILLTWRSRVDSLQWAMSIRLTAVVVPFAAVALLIPAVDTLATASAWDMTTAWAEVLNAALNATVAWSVLLLLVVTAESLGHECRPSSVAGLMDISRGRWLAPELVEAAARGYAVGALMLVSSELVLWVSQRTSLGTPNVPALDDAFSGFGLVMRLANVFLTTGYATFGLLLSTSLLGRIRPVPRWVVVIIPPLVITGIIAPAEGVPAFLQRFAVLLTGSVTVWRFGALTGAVAFWFWSAITNAWPMLLTDDDIRYSGVLLSMIALMPAAWATWIVWKLSVGPVRPTSVAPSTNR